VVDSQQQTAKLCKCLLKGMKMQTLFKLRRIAGIEIHLHISWLITAALIVMWLPRKRGAVPIITLSR
jgi:hypothetical protein